MWRVPRCVEREKDSTQHTQHPPPPQKYHTQMQEEVGRREREEIPTEDLTNEAFAMVLVLFIWSIFPYVQPSLHQNTHPPTNAHTQDFISFLLHFQH